MRIAAPLAARRGTPNSTFSNPVTPGCTSAKLYGLRATSGRLWTSRSLIVWPTSMRARSSAGLSALLTVIVSLTAPIDSVALTTAVCPTESRTSVYSNFLKPGSSTSTRYVPSGKSETDEDGKNLAHSASIQTNSRHLSMETEHVVAAIQFTGVVTEKQATR